MKRDNIIPNISATWLVWILFCALVVVILFVALNRWINCDELEAIHSSWKTLQGEKIYIDFFQNHHPFFYYLMLPVIAIFKESIATIIVLRIMVFLRKQNWFTSTLLVHVFGIESKLLLKSFRICRTTSTKKKKR